MHNTYVCICWSQGMIEMKNDLRMHSVCWTLKIIKNFMLYFYFSLNPHEWQRAFSIKICILILIKRFANPQLGEKSTF